MNDYKICKMSAVHRFEISSWDKHRKVEYIGKDMKIFENDFSPYNGYKKHLRELKKLKLSTTPGKGINEKCYYVLKNEDGKIVAFIHMHLRYGTHPGLYIATIDVHPLYRGQGYGTYLLKTILSNPQEYMSIEPEFVEAIIDSNNYKSMKLFESLASLEKKYYGLDYYNIKFDLKDFQKRNENKEYLL